ncbi:aryl hydrocarbon receptor-like [Emydura macquarii macquarii]|uniref:aryl hydrocarbon receptor-like n=1 Tax=Emydura macquarii macquarii TaxID=1129001 RepID=UPI00352BB9F8
MLPTGGVYAMKKRKKPVQKSPKPSPPEGIQSNPSKRHRDRLNQELNKLTSLLPFPVDVQARLDKLSILRLIVGYLKVKSYFMASVQNNGGCLADQPGMPGGNGRINPQNNGETFSEGDMLLQALNGFVIAITADGYIFYVSPTIEDYLGFHQSDIIYQNAFQLIHTDDRAMFRCQLHWALNPPMHEEPERGTEALPIVQTPVSSTTTAVDDHQHLPPENSPFLERSFSCRFRCLLDNSSGFLGLNFHGRLKFLHGQQKRAEDGTLMPPQLALFAIATPLQPLSILELRTQTFIFQTKHKLDFTPMACDSRGKVVLGYTETELCMRGSGYQFIHAADMMYCAENHVKIMKTGDSGMTVFRLLTKKAGWVWVQASARLVYKGGRPDCIISRQRALSNEEGEEHLRKRSLQLPFHFATGEAVLYENNLPGFLESLQTKGSKADVPMEQGSVDPSSLLGAMMKQDESIYVSHADDVPQFSLVDIADAPEEAWQDDRNKRAVKEENDSLLVIIETLFEKSHVESDISKTLQNLDMDDLELKQWEEILLKMDTEKSVAQDFQERLNDEVTSCMEKMLFKTNNRKNLGFPQYDMAASSQALIQQIPQSTQLNRFQNHLVNNTKCNQQNNPAVNFHHFWGANSAASAQPGIQNPMFSSPQNSVDHDHQGPLATNMSQDIASRPEKQAPFDQANLLCGNIPSSLGSSNQRIMAVNLTNPAQLFQPKAPAPVSLGNVIPKNKMHQASTLIASNHPAPLKMNAQESQWPAPLVSMNPVIGFNQNNSLGGYSSNVWESASPDQLGIQPMETDSQTVLANNQITNPWISSSQAAHYTDRGMQEFSITQVSPVQDLQSEISGSLVQKFNPLEAGHLSGSHSFPKHTSSHGPHLMPHFYNKEQQQMLQNKQLSTQQQQLMQARICPQAHSRPTQTQHNGLPVASCLGLSSHCQSCFQMGNQQMANVLESSLKSSSCSTLSSDVMLASWDYENSGSSFENDVAFPKATHVTSLPQQQNTMSCHGKSNPEMCYYQRPKESVLDSSVMPPMESDLRAPYYHLESNFPPLSLKDRQMKNQQQFFTYNIQFKCHQNEENASMEFTPTVARDSVCFPRY